MSMMRAKSHTAFKAAALAALTALAACGGPAEPTAEEVARETVKAVVGPAVGAQFPGVPTDILVDCIVDNATGSEILEIANSALLGSTTDSIYVITPIATRPATIQCIAAKTLGV